MWELLNLGWILIEIKVKLGEVYKILNFDWDTCIEFLNTVLEVKIWMPFL